MRGLELKCGNRTVATLRQRGLIGLSKYIGSYEDVPIELKVGSDWRNHADNISVTRTDTNDTVDVAIVYGIYSDCMLTMKDGQEYHIKKHRIDKLNGWYVSRISTEGT